jgi:hypothetical protein
MEEGGEEEEVEGAGGRHGCGAGQKVRVSVFGLRADRFSFKLGRSWWALPLL